MALVLMRWAGWIRYLLTAAAAAAIALELAVSGPEFRAALLKGMTLARGTEGGVA
jgi:hypothetical protein